MIELNSLSKGIQMVYLPSSLRKQSQQSEFAKNSHLQVRHAHVLNMCLAHSAKVRELYTVCPFFLSVFGSGLHG